VRNHVILPNDSTHQNTRENLKYERKITLPIPIRSNVFGVPLEDIMGYNGEKGGIPRVVKDAIQFLRDSGTHPPSLVASPHRRCITKPHSPGLQEEGLFRRSPSSSLLRSAQDAYDRGQVVSLSNFGDPHLAAVLLKKYLRDLPEPIFPESLYALVRRCPIPSNPQDEDGEMASVQYVRDVLLSELVPCAYILLSHVIRALMSSGAQLLVLILSLFRPPT
jgi:Rho GTPase-activating protein 1